MLKPYVDHPGVFASGDLKKSFFSGGLNKSKTLTGGGSGYRSEARKTVTDKSKYRVVGYMLPDKVIKTIVRYTKVSKSGETTTKEPKSIAKSGFIILEEALKMIPFTYEVEYVDIRGKKMTVTNTNIR